MSDSILDIIFAHKRQEVAGARFARPLATVRSEALSAPPPRDYLAALRAHRSRGVPALIAEIKRASPSAGSLRASLDPAHLAASYARHGAAALSVLTDQRFFQGDLSDLAAARRACDLPVLRKDFLFHPYQVYEARAAGADAVLLIAAMLEHDDLARLQHLARELGMLALVEVHDEAELRKALKTRPSLIGVNNRDLRTFTVDLRTTLDLVGLIPPETAVVAESGISDGGDAKRLAAAGVDAMLVGTSLVSAPDPGLKTKELTSGAGRAMLEGTHTQVKVCGITSPVDATAAVRAGVDLIGFNFYSPSPRSISMSQCRYIQEELAATVPQMTTVGVFVNASERQVVRTVRACQLDLVQLHGDETPAYVTHLRDRVGDRILQALRPRSLSDALTKLASSPPRQAAPALLVDARRPGAYGGTGKMADWSIAHHLAQRWPLLLAGGLTPENVREAIQQVSPWGIDVASGVETEPGQKSEQRMIELVRASRRTDAQSRSIERSSTETAKERTTQQQP
jgi:indole-3-glycerol phosphate synthase/phosphoribosylanthranilate isomerase